MSVYSDGNKIYLNTNVTQESANELIKLINEINSQYDEITNNKLVKSIIYNPIMLHINSNGGDLDQALMLYELIKKNKYPINTVIDSQAYSAASIIYLSAKQRYMRRFASIMIHSLSTTYDNQNLNEIKSEYYHDKKLNEFMIKIYLENSNLTIKQIKKIMKGNNKYIYIDDAIKFGFVHDYY
jgi:ATP-dependent protease ClpP protease subunit